MSDCLFCKIANKEIQSKIVKEDEKWLCFEDTSPKAPLHWLLIPKKHYNNLHSVDDDGLFETMFKALKDLVEEAGLTESGYRIVANTGKDGGQTVNHVHFHLLAKRPLGWPPG